MINTVLSDYFPVRTEPLPLKSDNHEQRVQEVLSLLAKRSGVDSEGLTSTDWAQDVLWGSQFFPKMKPQEFALLLQVICQFPPDHPIYKHLVTCVEEVVL
jgi:hypothetical protein